MNWSETCHYSLGFFAKNLYIPFRNCSAFQLWESDQSVVLNSSRKIFSFIKQKEQSKQKSIHTSCVSETQSQETFFWAIRIFKLTVLQMFHVDTSKCFTHLRFQESIFRAREMKSKVCLSDSWILKVQAKAIQWMVLIISMESIQPIKTFHLTFKKK